MSDSTQHRPGPGRPSLLTPAQAPAAENRGILSQLDGEAAPAWTAAKPRKRGVVLSVLAVALAGAGAVLWFVQDDAAHAPQAMAAAATPARAGVSAPEAAPSVAEVSAVLAAAAPAEPAAARIEDETPSEPARADGPATLAPSNVLAQALSAPPAAQAGRESAPAADAGKDELAPLLAAAPSQETPKAAQAPVKRADKDAPRKDAKKKEAPRLANADKQRSKPAPVKQKAAPKKAEPPVDSDVALLAALLAHAKSPAPSKAASDFKRCAASGSSAEAERCRVRLCEGSAKGAAECKGVRISKASS